MRVTEPTDTLALAVLGSLHADPERDTAGAIAELLDDPHLTPREVAAALGRLRRRGLVSATGRRWTLTPARSADRPPT